MIQTPDSGRGNNSDEAIADAIREMIAGNAFEAGERITES